MTRIREEEEEEEDQAQYIDYTCTAYVRQLTVKSSNRTVKHTWFK